jgi:endonuclease YncB( thermonuclease family)
LLFWSLAASAFAAHADTIAGRASVIDGDTIDIHGAHIRILDVDAPESRQSCQDQDGKEWRCGQKAALALSDWIGAHPVTCETTRKDKFHRWLARCTVAGQDLGEWMAAQGWVVPFRDCKCETVRDAAKAAKLANLGIWSGTFMMPWDFRARQAGQGATGQSTIAPLVQSQGSAACQIKGNINSEGERIYHVPGGKWYDKTEINTSKGERWFCSEAEAKAAGWRPSKQ